MVAALRKFGIEPRIPLGSLINGAMIVVGLIWAWSADLTKTATVAANASARIEILDKTSAAQDNRLVALETGQVFIRESLSRIESAVTKK